MQWIILACFLIVMSAYLVRQFFSEELTEHDERVESPAGALDHDDVEHLRAA